MYNTIIYHENCPYNNGIIAGESFSHCLQFEFKNSIITDGAFFHFIEPDKEYSFILHSNAVCLTKKTADKIVKFHKNFSYDITFVKNKNDESFFAYVVTNGKAKKLLSASVTDWTETALNENLKIGIYTDDGDEFIYVNSTENYSKAYTVLKKRINEHHAKNGVVFIDRDNAYIDFGVSIGEGTVIGPNVTISEITIIGKYCKIGSNTIISNSVLGDNVVVTNSYISDSALEDGDVIEPFSYIKNK